MPTMVSQTGVWYTRAVNVFATSDFRPGIVDAVVAEIIPLALRATQRATQIVETAAHAGCPRGETGELDNSIQSEVSLTGTTVQGSVEATAPYAAFVEYGTGLRGEASPHGELPEEGVPITGGWVYDYRGTGWQGMPAQPFLRPALDNNERAILEAFASEGFYI